MIEIQQYRKQGWNCIRKMFVNIFTYELFDSKIDQSNIFMARRDLHLPAFWSTHCNDSM